MMMIIIMPSQFNDIVIFGQYFISLLSFPPEHLFAISAFPSYAQFPLHIEFHLWGFAVLGNNNNF